MKKALIIRTGAYGDMLIISPLFRALKETGHYTILQTGQRGIDVLKNNPFVDEIIKYDLEGKDNPLIEKEWKELKDKINPDYFRNFAESIEVNISLHPKSPIYNYPKQERYVRGNRNFYEVTQQLSGVLFRQLRPELFFDKEEIETVTQYIKKDKFNILWALSGSGGQKVYPWTDYVMGEVLKNYDNVHFITVGDERCQILEGMIDDKNITNLSGEISFRQSMMLTSLVDLVISPDTGVLHASGAFNTPKIGLLGHTNIENITKHFVNDYSLEAVEELAPCSPCFRLIYDHRIQCPVDRLTMGAWCMSIGQPKQRLYKRIEEVMKNHGNGKATKKSTSIQEGMSDMHQTNSTSS